MICRRCLTEGEVAYSVLSNGWICLVPECGWELEMDPGEAYDLLMAPEQEALCA